MFGGDMTLRLQFTMNAPLLEGAVLLDLGNGITTPMDNFMWSVGEVHGQYADLIIRAYQKGQLCEQKQSNGQNTALEACVMVIPGMLTPDRPMDVIMTFSAGITTLYVNGVSVRSTRRMLTPASVFRPYSFVGRSLVTTPSVPCNIKVRSLSIGLKPMTALDVENVTPKLRGTYVYTFRPEDEAAMADTLSEPYPLYHAGNGQTMWRDNPFNELAAASALFFAS